MMFREQLREALSVFRQRYGRACSGHWLTFLSVHRDDVPTGRFLIQSRLVTMKKPWMFREEGDEERRKGPHALPMRQSFATKRVNSKGSKLILLVNGQYLHADSTLVSSDAQLYEAGRGGIYLPASDASLSALVIASVRRYDGSSL